MRLKTLYVGNLPHTLSDQELQNLFARYGACNGRMMPGRGHGFVDVEEDQVDSAIRDKNGGDLNGRNLVVKIAGADDTDTNRSSGGFTRRSNPDSSRGKV